MIRIIDENGEYFISQSEYDAILAIKKVWSKSAHMAEVNSLHDNEFERLLSSRNYISMSELSLWAQSADSEYYNEANALLSWYTSTYLTIEQYASTVNEENALDPQAFIETLPAFSFGE